MAFFCACLLVVVVLKHGAKAAHFTSKWTTVWHYGVEDASFNTHLQPLHSPIAMDGDRPSLETPA